MKFSDSTAPEIGGVVKYTPPVKTQLVYISTPLKPEKFYLDQIQAKILETNVFAFIPPQAATTIEPEKAAIINKRMIEQCDEVWVFGPIGRDCAWEMGYAQALKKPVKFHVSPANEGIIKTDWMLFMPETQVIQPTKQGE